MSKLVKAGFISFGLLFMGIVLAACRSEQTEATGVVTGEATRAVTKTDAVDGQTAEVTRVVQEVVEVPVSPADSEGEEVEPVTLTGYDTALSSLDPQLADPRGFNATESLFVQLTNYALDSAEVVPEAASSWTISDDGLVYTFNIRTDIPWVSHNLVTGETSQVLDEEGNPRFVTAYDFEKSIKRACGSDVANYSTTIIAPLIVGCDDVFNIEDRDDKEALAAATEAMGVTAMDDSTLEIRLNFPASYFLSITPMVMLSATPQWLIEEHGNDAWQEAGRIVTNGRFVLHEWIHDTRSVMQRNPLIPADLAGQGNIERIVQIVVPDNNTGYLMWLNNEVETSGIPDAELQAHLEQSRDETIQIPDLAVFYFGFRESKPPFDAPQVRRAFSAAFDRETFMTEVQQGQGQPMIHLAPPGIFGAPPIDEVGVGFDPEFARQQLAAAGYPDCEGFPEVHILGFDDSSALSWLEFAQNQWSKNLGCSPDLIQIEQLPFEALRAAIDKSVPDTDAPHMWTAGWGPDYPDENNWVGDLLWCESISNDYKRQCDAADELIVEARQETDPARRVAIYRQIEELFFGPEGEYPIAPIFLRSYFQAQHNWLTESTRALFSGQQFYNWVIDQEAKAAALQE